MKIDGCRVLITGRGFVGSYLKVFLEINKISNIIILNKSDYKNLNSLKKKIKNIDIIFHNAASVKKSKNVIKENLNLNRSLLSAIDINSLKLFIHFGSTHEKLNSFYGISKKRSYNEIKKFLKNKNIPIIRFTIPNLYGCYYRPYHNSFISTLIYEMVKNNTIENIKDINSTKVLELVYINDLISKILKTINVFKIKKDTHECLNVKIIGKKISIGKFINIINSISLNIANNVYKASSKFERELLNIFLSYRFMLNKFNIKPKLKLDERGYLYEIHKSFGANQFFISNSKLNSIRGRHFHTNKYEIFHVLRGSAEITMHNLITNNKKRLILDEKNKNILFMPPFVKHIFKSTNKNTLTMFYSSEIFNSNKPDTFSHEE